MMESEIRKGTPSPLPAEQPSSRSAQKPLDPSEAMQFDEKHADTEVDDQSRDPPM
jgi:hypothetical protein